MRDEQSSAMGQSRNPERVQVAPDRVLLYCRNGFERECAMEAEIQGGRFGIDGRVQADAGSGFVIYTADPGRQTSNALRRMRLRDLIFARQMVFTAPPLVDLSPDDRIGPLLEAAARLQPGFADCWLETADTNDAKALSTFLRKFDRPFRRALAGSGLMDHRRSHRLHIFFQDSGRAFVGFSEMGNSAPWPMGIPRLKFPKGAPSRSTLKLEEAILVFVSHPESWLGPGMSAVDLGAAPGGWTFQMVRRHIRTTAVDNGRLDASLLESGLVEHIRADGFRYRPPKPVDWLLCDMVEQPYRISLLIAEWISDGLCRHAIFNLKLPMKKRLAEAERCHRAIAERLARAGISGRVEFKQLFHDRAEITGFVSREQV